MFPIYSTQQTCFISVFPEISGFDSEYFYNTTLQPQSSPAVANIGVARQLPTSFLYPVVGAPERLSSTRGVLVSLRNAISTSVKLAVSASF